MAIRSKRLNSPRKSFDHMEIPMNIYIGNLSYETTEEDLQNAFSEFGEVVSAKIIRDQYSGRSKGFGFVEMPDRIEANAAIANLNKKELKGRQINVNVAKPRSNKTGGRGKQFGKRY
jgi:RNA recognition motif-containing protein